MGKFIEHYVLASFQAGSLYMVGKIGPGSPKPLSPLFAIYKGKRKPLTISTGGSQTTLIASV